MINCAIVNRDSPRGLRKTKCGFTLLLCYFDSVFKRLNVSVIHKLIKRIENEHYHMGIG